METTTKANKTTKDILDMVLFLEYYLTVISSRIPTYIDKGGCGFFAKYLAKNLREMGFDCKIKYVTDSRLMKDINYVITNKSCPKKGEYGFNHCYVSLGEYMDFDSTGLIFPIESEVECRNKCEGMEKRVTGELDDETLDLMLSHVGSWNDVFDRDCVPMIEAELSKLSEKFEKFRAKEKLELPSIDVELTKHTVKAMDAQRSAEMASQFFSI